MTGFDAEGMRSSSNSYRRARASLAAFDKAIYSASIIENATIDYLYMNHMTASPLIRNT